MSKKRVYLSVSVELDVEATVVNGVSVWPDLYIFSLEDEIRRAVLDFGEGVWTSVVQIQTDNITVEDI